MPSPGTATAGDAAGARTGPPQGPPPELPQDGWLPVDVPGTAAAALRAALGEDAMRAADLDADDWWFRTRVDVPRAGSWLLTCEGIATVCDVWIDDLPLAHSDSMFRQVQASVGLTAGTHVITVRCAALAPFLVGRRPRPRWRSRLVGEQGLRWVRTSLLGRMPALAPHAAPVGPWRPVSLRPLDVTQVLSATLHATVVGHGGRVDATLRVHRPASEAPGSATVRVRARDGASGETVVALPAGQDSPEVDVSVELPAVDLWWPHTHGEQPLYDVELEVDGERHDLGRVGFRTVAVDRTDGAFTLVVNGVPLFARGAAWVPPDVVSLSAGTRGSLSLLREAGLNLVRVTGTTTYQDADFWDACDDLGLLVWQDVMLATLDPPDDAAFLAELAGEVAEMLAPVAGRPSLVVLSGGSETEQQPVMMGLPAARRAIPAIESVIPAVAARVIPEVPYLTSSPSGGDLPIHVGTGVAHYFGVGGYRRPLGDARAAHVRFAAECLAFSVPPEATAVHGWFGAGDVTADPRWRQGTPHDAGSPWDFSDVTDHYAREVLDQDPDALRSGDPRRALDVSRAAVVETMGQVLTEWRRPGSSCAGAIVLSWQDLLPGPGWGLLDAAGRPKAPWFALRRLMAPMAVLVTDEGLDGMVLHLLNDGAAALDASVHIAVHGIAGGVLLEASAPVRVPARGGLVRGVDGLLGEFRDIAYAYRFGDRTYDALEVRLLDPDGAELAGAVGLLGGAGRDLVDDVGLSARAVTAADGGWELEVRTRDLAQFVVVDLPGYRSSDSWFHLPAGASRRVRLAPLEPLGPPDPPVAPPAGAQVGAPVGVVRALNSRLGVEVSL